MNSTTTALTSTTDADEGWEPFIHEGVEVGEVHWLSQETRGDGPVVSGLWRISAEAGAALPYAVAGTEIFHVLEGEAVLEQPDGTSIKLVPGVVISLPDGYTATWRTLSDFKKFFVVA
jgi:uncharacterized cupin superfamily protein